MPLQFLGEYIGRVKKIAHHHVHESDQDQQQGRPGHGPADIVVESVNPGTDILKQLHLREGSFGFGLEGQI